MNASSTIDDILQQAIRHHHAGQFQQAESLYRTILGMAPNHPDANHNLGVLARQMGNDLASLPFFKAAFEANPAFDQYLLSYAMALLVTEQVQDALASLLGTGKYAEIEILSRCLIQRRPDAGTVWKMLGTALLLQTKRATEELSKAVELLPDDPDCLHNLATALLRDGRYAEAVGFYQHAIQLKPDFMSAYNNLGLTLMELKQFVQAADCFRQVLRVQPDSATSHHYLGVALVELGQMELALVAFQEAVRLAPDWIGSMTNLAMVQRDLRQLTEAETSFRKAVELEPHKDYLFGNWIQTRLQICEWENLDRYIEDLEARTNKAQRALTPFASLSLSSSRSVQATAAALSAQADFAGIESIPFIEPRPPRNRIRVGYFSADFYQHATAQLMAELFERHDRERFELFAYSFGPKTGDPMQLRLMAAFDHFIDVSGMPDRDIAVLARQHGIDIAVDLKGYTRGSRTGIFAWRAAPVQVNYIGYPGTMNMPWMDYVIADPTLIPAAHQHDYGEKIVYLPHTYQVNDRQRRIADTPMTRAEMGLPDQAFVFCCFNNNYKILPATFDAWMRILRAVDGSVLWLFEDNPDAARNLRKEAERRGVQRDRLVFAQRCEPTLHLARHRLADLFLDTLPYNAHTTASDALWAGLPVLTLIGDTFAGRVAASLLNAIRVPELITATRAQFEDKAIALARDPLALGAIKDKLAAHRLTTPLFDAPMFARHIEAAYSHMVERYQAGLAPDHIIVPSA